MYVRYMLNETIYSLKVAVFLLWHKHTWWKGRNIGNQALSSVAQWKDKSQYVQTEIHDILSSQKQK